MKKNKEKLNTIRRKIDETDAQITRLLNKRASLAKQTSQFKAETVYDPEREKEVIKKISKNNSGPLNKIDLENIYSEILSVCRGIQKPKTISYLGPIGSHTQGAANKKFGIQSEKIHSKTIKDVFLSVEQKEADFGIVPLENSIEGPVGETLDEFLVSPVKIVGEFSRKIRHSLLSKQKDISKIKAIYSHPQALAQSKRWIAKNMPDVTLKESPSTSEAAKFVSKNPIYASISPDVCSKIYNLNILHSSVNDDKNNTTIFIIISRDQEEVSILKNTKVSIVFTLPDKPGSLFECLKPLKAHNLNLTKIQSRPSRKIQWDYNFFVDILVGSKVEETKKGLEKIKKIASYFRILGAY
ncbi:prephenate dehydratase [bacterium]|nr:prephenate dehydratase [bacterium]